MYEINEPINNTDVTSVLGANGIVNNAATDDPNSQNVGMPILRVWSQKKVVALSTGYAAIYNPLFCQENTDMHMLLD